MADQQPSRWQPNRRQLLWAGGIAALAFLIIVICGYLFGWKWTGLVKDANFHSRTLWDWLQLLIVPAVLAAVGLWFNVQQRVREQQVASARAQDEALQAYLDQMSDLLLEKDLRGSEVGSEVRTLATARTINMVTRLDGEHNRNLVRFLVEAGLIYKFHSRLDESSGLIESGYPIIILSQADLSKAELSGATLIGAYLGEVDLSEADLRWASLYEAVLGGANLSKANLSEAWLDNAILPGANLSGANLSGAGLTEAVLGGANLSNANLNGATLTGANLSGFRPGELLPSGDFGHVAFGADLSGADLRGADLSGAILSEVNFNGAKLGGANLSGTNLRHATGKTAEQLEGQASSLEGAIMPNGQKYEDWLKSKDRGEDGENSGP